jgi:signal transduction histidine kinase
MFVKNNKLKQTNVILSLFLLLLFSCTKRGDNDTQGAIIVESLLDSAGSTNKTKEQKVEFYLEAYGIIQKKEKSGRKIQNLFFIVKGLNELKEFEKMDKVNYSFLNDAVRAKDTISTAYSYYFAGNSNFFRNVQDSAFYYYLKAEKLFLKSKHEEVLANLYLNKSSIQLVYIDFLGAENSATQSLKYSKLFEDKLGQYDALTNLGIASQSSENYEKAIEYNKAALNLAKRNDLNPEYFLQEISLNNIGNCYIFLKKYNQAIKEFETALGNRNIIEKKPGLYATLLDNLSYAKFKLNDDKQTLAMFLKSLSIREKLKLDSKVVYSKIHLSEYFSERDSIKSQKYANEALALSKKTGRSEDLLLALKQISQVEHKNASQYSKEYIKISDSIQLEERKSKDKFARIAFETDEIILEKDKLAEQNRSLLYFFVGSLFVGLLLFVIRTQRAKNRELLLKQQQQKANEDIYNLMISQQATIEESRTKEKKRIAQELHDGVLGRLFGARLNLDSLNKFTDEESIKNRFNYLDELKNIEQDIREISHDLNREKYVLINNFVAIVHNLLEEQKSSFAPEIKFSIDESIKWDTVPNAVKINLYRILQESLQNINKYANASNIFVGLESHNEQVTLKVSDDGAGFDVSGRKKGIGLQNMLSRANECNGSLDITSKKGKGTTIKITVPLNDKSLIS